METYILIASIEANDKFDIEDLEGSTFENPKDALSQINVDTDITNKCIPLSEFIDMVNNEEFNYDNCWITSVKIQKPQ